MQFKKQKTRNCRTVVHKLSKQNYLKMLKYFLKNCQPEIFLGARFSGSQVPIHFQPLMANMKNYKRIYIRRNVSRYPGYQSLADRWDFGDLQITFYPILAQHNHNYPTQRENFPRSVFRHSMPETFPHMNGIKWTFNDKSSYFKLL